jgi:hypothetical protein
MEEIYLVYAKAISIKAATNAVGIGNINAIIFVGAKSQEGAIILARSALMDYEYRLTSVLEIFVPTSSDISNLDPQLLALYNESIDRGYGLEIITQDVNHDHPFEIRSLGIPILDKTKKY